MKTTLIAVNDVNSRQSIIGISLLAKLVAQHGHSVTELLTQADICAQLLNDAKATISFQQEVAFTQALIKTLKDDELGFKAGQCYRLNAFGHIGLAAGCSDTVRDAIAFFLKYIRLAYTHFSIDFFQKDGNAVLRFTDQYELGNLRRFYLERDFSFAFLSTRDMFPRSIKGQKPKTIHFDFPCPTSIEHYQELYECTVHFSMAHNQILFDERYLDLPLPLANPLTRELLEEQCKSQEIALYGSERIDDKIRAVIQASQGKMPNLDGMAAMCFFSTRTLRRKLKERGVTFQQLLNEELHKKALHYLLSTHLTIEQISQRLGYSESASFNHAFKRWTGKTPNAYRQ